MYTLVEVTDKKTEQAFIELPVELYKDCPYWIRPWDHDIQNVFNKEKNPCFKETAAQIDWLG